MSRTSEFNTGAFTGTSVSVVEDPEGKLSNMDNPSTNLNSDFKDYNGKEAIPLKASLSGTV